MKAIVCEMCGGQQLTKEDGFFVCQSCGTKYSTEEARKLMVEIQGSVTVDRSAELANLKTLALRAQKERNIVNAQKYFEQILVLDPNSWDANLFSVLYAALMSDTPQNYVRSVSGSISTSLPLLRDNVDPSLYTENLTFVSKEIDGLANQIYNISNQKFYDIKRNEKSTSFDFNTASQIFENSVGLLNYFATTVLKVFGNDYTGIALPVLKKCIQLYSDIQRAYGTKSINVEYKNKIVATIRQYEPDYKDPTSGCYVATAVYGSYDCPQVWTLRRYRDYTLAESWYGRLFIRVYYDISPTIVKWFGHTEWFKKMWRRKLDRMVSRLNSQGVEDSPYNDRIW